MLYTSGLLMKFVARRELVAVVVQRLNTQLWNLAFQTSSQHYFNCNIIIYHIKK